MRVDHPMEAVDKYVNGIPLSEEAHKEVTQAFDSVCERSCILVRLLGGGDGVLLRRSEKIRRRELMEKPIDVFSVRVDGIPVTRRRRSSGAAKDHLRSPRKA